MIDPNQLTLLFELVLPWVGDIQTLGRLACVSKDMKQILEPKWTSERNRLERSNTEYCKVLLMTYQYSCPLRDIESSFLGVMENRALRVIGSTPKEWIHGYLLHRIRMLVECLPHYFRWDMQIVTLDGDVYSNVGQTAVNSMCSSWFMLPLPERLQKLVFDHISRNKFEEMKEYFRQMRVEMTASFDVALMYQTFHAFHPQLLQYISAKQIKHITLSSGELLVREPADEGDDGVLLVQFSNRPADPMCGIDYFSFTFNRLMLQEWRQS